MLLGFHATTERYEVHPPLPTDCPSLTNSGICFHDLVLTLTAHADGSVEVK